MNLKSLYFCLFLSLLFSVSSAQQPKKIQLEDVVGSRKFYPKTIREIRSMNDGEHYTTLDNDSDIVRYRYMDGKMEDIPFSLKNYKNKKIPYLSGYEFNRDETKILLTTNEEQIYRHSFTANYYVFDIKEKTLVAVSVNGKEQLATFSPLGDKVAFVRQNNIYVSDLITHAETQLTFDGKHNEIINGAPDWVYEEEFGFSKAFEWAPDGKKLAFMKFDESKVKMFTIPVYDSLYPSLYTYKYPKAGEENSVVSICVFDFESHQTKTMDVGNEKDQYIPRIKWTENPDKLGIVRLNRHQDKVDVLLADVQREKTNLLFSEKNNCFISEINDEYLTFLKDGKHFLIFSERDRFNHLYLYDMEGKMVNQVTKGNYDVDHLLGVDSFKGIVYYTSTEASPLERHIYAVKLDGSKKIQLTDQKGTDKAEFSSNFKYFIHTWSDANVPPSVTLRNSLGKTIRVLEDNKELQQRIAEYKFGRKEFMSIPSPGGMTLNAFLIKPADFDSTQKYPVFITVYGGPESQEVTDGWDNGIAWYQLLVQHGYLVACIDNRGTDGRGEAFKKSTYLQLGKLETEDQVNAALYLSSLSFVDGTRIGIFGWSYGGYMSSLCLTKGGGLFKMGIAVAPVTNWRFYDSIYTERFMRTPQENASGYDDNSPINFADKLKGKFLLIHGSADDNVHLQNTMVFAEKLIQSNKLFDMAIYPDKSHSIYGGKTRLHLYTKMTEFILKEL
jgi:dipeptidyl-peptidase 4